MNDSQVITLSIAVLVILAARLVNNVRVGDVKEVIRAQVDTRFAKLDLSLEIRFSSIDRKLDELLRVVAGQDHRIRELEERGR
jgi:hypothetical protein